MSTHIVGEYLSSLLEGFLNSDFVVTLIVLSFLFHALNGIRILIMDTFPFGDEEKLSITALVVFLIISVFFLVRL